MATRFLSLAIMSAAVAVSPLSAEAAHRWPLKPVSKQRIALHERVELQKKLKKEAAAIQAQKNAAGAKYDHAMQSARDGMVDGIVEAMKHSTCTICP